MSAKTSRCTSREILDLIADKWSVLVLGALMGGTLRHAELRRKIEGISQKMLTQTLRDLSWPPAAEADSSDIPGLISAVERVLHR